MSMLDDDTLMAYNASSALTHTNQNAFAHAHRKVFGVEVSIDAANHHGALFP